VEHTKNLFIYFMTALKILTHDLYSVNIQIVPCYQDPNLAIARWISGGMHFGV